MLTVYVWSTLFRNHLNRTRKQHFHCESSRDNNNAKNEKKSQLQWFIFAVNASDWATDKVLSSIYIKRLKGHFCRTSRVSELSHFFGCFLIFFCHISFFANANHLNLLQNDAQPRRHSLPIHTNETDTRRENSERFDCDHLFPFFVYSRCCFSHQCWRVSWWFLWRQWNELGMKKKNRRKKSVRPIFEHFSVVNGGLKWASNDLWFLNNRWTVSHAFHFRNRNQPQTEAQRKRKEESEQKKNVSTRVKHWNVLSFFRFE